jgi:outer membrane protein OmpA-like peptidoglycan-associated protein
MFLKSCKGLAALFVFGLTVANAPRAQDIEDAIEHPLMTRYPGQEIRWQQIENYMPYRVPLGPVAGYRAIAEWLDTEGRVTRTFFRYQGEDRSYAEIYKNYLDALTAQDFEILGEGFSADRRGNEVGGRAWQEVLYRENATTRPGEVGTMYSGTSSSGGSGSIVARKDRAGGTVYVVLSVEQHSANYVGALVDIVEVEAAETGLVVVDAEAMGADIDEYGRVVLDGLVFDFDQATLRPESDAALAQIAAFLAANPDKLFYVVGHTDSVGTFAYNQQLAAARARTVVDTLQLRFDVAAARLEPHGVGPLVPVFSNEQEAGRERNRRVELVERPPAQ